MANNVIETIKDLLARLTLVIRSVWAWLKSSPIAFWISLVLLNYGLFAGHFLFTKELQYLFPFHLLFDQAGGQNQFSWLFDRDLQDIWKLSIDFFLLLVISGIVIRKFPSTLILMLWLVPIVYSFLFFYQIYETAIYRIYYRQPDLLHDYFLIKNGFLILINEPKLLLIAIPIFLGYSIILVVLFKIILSHRLLPRFTLMPPAIVIAVLTIVSFFVTSYDSTSATFRFIGAQLKQNIETANLNRGNREIDFNKLKQANQGYDQFQLSEKPNLIVVFVESYGKKALNQESVNPKYTASIKAADSLLTANDLYAASHLSIAPVSGGSSWISFSSALYGFYFEHHTFFDYLVNHKEIESCLNLYRWLQHQGYEGYFLSPFKPKNYYVPVEEYKRYYALPNWLGYEHYEDYEGHRFGWNLPPNDQYVLNYSYDYIKRDTSSPRSLFYMTKNSHYPFHSPLGTVKDWRALKIKEGKTPRVTEPTLINYLSAMSFQIDYLTQFVLDEANETDIFVIVGDHQPPKLVSEGEGFETPIHVISRDSAFVASFDRYGFKPSLTIGAVQEPMRHEAFLSMMVREMVRRYGQHTTQLPEYLPRGVQ